MCWGFVGILSKNHLCISAFICVCVCPSMSVFSREFSDHSRLRSKGLWMPGRRAWELLQQGSAAFPWTGLWEAAELLLAPDQDESRTAWHAAPEGLLTPAPLTLWIFSYCRADLSDGWHGNLLQVYVKGSFLGQEIFKLWNLPRGKQHLLCLRMFLNNCLFPGFIRDLCWISNESGEEGKETQGLWCDLWNPGCWGIEEDESPRWFSGSWWRVTFKDCWWAFWTNASCFHPQTCFWNFGFYVILFYIEEKYWPESDKMHGTYLLMFSEVMLVKLQQL